MLKIAQGNSRGLGDVDAFLRTLNTLSEHPSPQARDFLRDHAEVVVARAPGRLDLMGGIADYSGSLVLQMPIREAALVALQRSDDRVLRFLSLSSEGSTLPARLFETSLDSLFPGGRPLEYSAARQFFQKNNQARWAAYAAGAILVLAHERGVFLEYGVSVLIRSDVPEGKGVSSSAALEVAVMYALLASLGVKIPAREVALLCQRVENLVVGAPCGAMDQMTSACGQEDRLLALLCQPAELCDPIQIPAGISIVGFDSGIRHAVTGAAYGEVRAGAFMGYRIIAVLAGLPVHADPAGGVQIHDSRWHGYLANIPPSEFEAQFRDGLPHEMSGAEFLARYQGTTDSLTRIEPSVRYAIRIPTAHPVYENFRVQAFARLLREEVTPHNLRQLGECMFASHASYSACGLGCKETDFLVELARQAEPRGVHGAKITGGGSGGTVVMLGDFSAETVSQIAAAYAGPSGRVPHVFSGSSPGAEEFGVLRLKRVN
jgi:galactokinase